MNYIEKLIKENFIANKRIVLTEPEDIRVLRAASYLTINNIVRIVLIGENELINRLALDNNIDISKTEIISFKDFNDTDEMIEQLYSLRKDKGLTKEEAENLIKNNNMYFACMLLYNDYVDGVVSGAIHSTKETLLPALQIIKTKEKLASSCFLMHLNNFMGKEKCFVFGDCGLQQNPNASELADIAYQCSKTYNLLTKDSPIVAMLSHSTKGSAKHLDVDKVVEATKIANERYPEVLIDGELQLDAALIEEVARSKCPDSKVGGKANVLIFPDLDAGNIGYKLVQRFASADAYGPIMQGLKKPVNDLSRGSTVDDIIGTVVITAIQSLDK